MKSILIYSGKGGVGKTTITYSLYKAYKALGKNVLVLDGDINTPSMHHLIKEDLISNEKSNSIFVNKGTIRQFVNSAIKQIKEINPDILLIDTPPSITDVHQVLIKKLKISSVLLVSQPTILSKSDVERTVPFFAEKGITTLGIVENMYEGERIDYAYDKLASVPKEEKLNSELVYKNNESLFLKLAEKIDMCDLAQVTQELKRRILFNEDISELDVMKMYNIIQGECEGEYQFSRNRNNSYNYNEVKFVNMKTWNVIRSALLYVEEEAGRMFNNSTKDPVTFPDIKQIERLLNAFKHDSEALFMITRAPHTEIPLLVSEIGTCTLKVDDKFRGVPTVEYRTSKGSVRLFAHEVTPASDLIIEDNIRCGSYYIEDGTRLIPSFEQYGGIADTFGRLLNMSLDVESLAKEYEKVSGGNPLL